MTNNEIKRDDIHSVPQYGWKVKFNHEFPEKRDQNIIPRMSQLPQLLPLFCRYLAWYGYIKLKGRKPFIDCVKMRHGKQMYGVPLGGIGSGTIGRGFKGEFCRFQMVPGIYEYETVMANQFIVSIADADGKLLYQKVLSPHRAKNGLGSWEWGFNAEDASYCGLYPRSWTSYDIKEQKIRLVCRQISPVIPHDYKDSCLPVGVFVWSIENLNPEPRRVSLAFTFKNGTGSSNDKEGGCWTESFEEAHPEQSESDSTTGVMLHQTIKGIDLTYCLAVRANESENVKGSVCVGFNPVGSGKSIWDTLKKDGLLTNSQDPFPKTRKGEEVAVAVCGRCLVPGNSVGGLEMCLSWDMPKIVFKSRGQNHTRRYTRWFNNPKTAAKDIAIYALSQYKIWETKIDEWQLPILQDRGLPDWFKSALFNELYFVSDGGSLWLEMPDSLKEKDLPSHDPRLEYGRFAYLESHEYRMYNTYDVHFYASWALVTLWPMLQKCLQYDVANFTKTTVLNTRTYLYSGNKGPVKAAYSVPHDLGDPEDEPFVNINSYLIHDVNEWKDLNLKFVLQVYRDFKFFKDEGYLRDLWPVARATIEKSLSHDRDGDGLIENSGQADQTYDSWVMHGSSAYCSSLWLAALAAAADMAERLCEYTDARKYAQILAKAKAAYFKKLWNGQYFNFDMCENDHGRSIMSDQLVGHWYLSLSGLDAGIYDEAHVSSVLKILFENNVMKFKGGRMGPVNGMNANGTVDKYTLQSEEMWTGVAYSLASLFIQEGMVTEGFKTAEGVYRTVYETIGLGFETPEAVYADKKYRAIGYMRPLSIWSMYVAYKNLNKKRDVGETPKTNGH